MESNQNDKIISKSHNLSLEQQLDWQLTANHYPPVDKSFIPVAMRAIEYANNNEWDVMLEYPNGLRRDVRFTIENLHLDLFLEEEE